MLAISPVSASDERRTFSIVSVSCRFLTKSARCLLRARSWFRDKTMLSRNYCWKTDTRKSHQSAILCSETLLKLTPNPIVHRVTKGSAAMSFKCGGICTDHFVVNFSPSLLWNNFENQLILREVIGMSRASYYLTWCIFLAKSNTVTQCYPAVIVWSCYMDDYWFTSAIWI